VPTRNLTLTDRSDFRKDVNASMDNENMLKRLKDIEKDSREKAIRANLATYQQWNQWGIVMSISMILYAAKKLLFNIFATIKLPMDVWSKIDFFCAFTNIFAFMMLSFMDEESVTDTEKKQFYNLMMILTILSTWLRFLGILFVI
jgi:hypothetical protein